MKIPARQDAFRPGVSAWQSAGLRWRKSAHAAIFEAVHGSAPDIAGQGIANPLALLLAAATMLDHVGRHDAALKLRGAIDGALRDDGVRTGDLGGNATTHDMTQAIVRRVLNN